MLGNWSFNNNYFKEDACKYALDLLTNYYGIDKQRLIVTYFGGDENLKEDIDVKKIWLNLGFPSYKVIPLNDCFWEMNVTGPCGVCTEIHYINNLDLIKQSTNSLELLNNSIEIWNLVFIQYERTETELKNLNNKHVDTGMGLGILAILNETESNFNTDLFLPLIKILETEIPNVDKYSNSLTKKLDISYRIVVDHIRAIVVLIADDVKPGHTNEGLIIRKLIRRTNDILRNDFQIKVPKYIFNLLINKVIEILDNAYPELKMKKDQIIYHVNDEVKWQLKSTQSTRKYLLNLKNNQKDTSQKLKLTGQETLKLRRKGAITKEELNRLANEQNIEIDWLEHDQLVDEEIKKSNEIKEKKKLDKIK